MKITNNIFIIALLFIGIAFTTQCKKDNDNSTVTFNFKSGEKFISSDKTVNPGDSLIFNWNITSTLPMDSMIISKNGTFISGWSISSASRYSFNSGDTIINYNAKAGSYEFIIFDSLKHVIGRKSITINTNSDFTYYTNRVLFVPDTTAKTNQCYFSSSTGNTYSYTNIGSNVNSVDFGYYFGTTAKHTLYSLSDNQVAIYDISTWSPLNVTYLKKLSGVTFANILSAHDIQVACGVIGTATKVEGLAATNIIGFKTATGKYGLINFKSKNADTGNSSTYCAIEVKVQN